ncbi:hypothetical protein LTR10_017454 [Elasticomyces elasticus]|uniref:Transcription activator GCR1-like domain-containing protein n=1 Tax=Exophiala sideris TaxID=1016849 RepID=A0ABR0JAS6_9EURO|nr:hypothetical protein LTR10_017454 [Elasticomyces elasticus]KAK5030364.1 hypothetical protein LTS07_005148 [Exophiala sideris]KAK5038417.1 hypothetical protein LTR13_004164 [Exophiala sideris]KAK5060300.1 hypothetical protein LTR69_005617 [Exophiala sideris]KAK5183211.1 hypothetical protein LTR44_004212 [Eurotiomycetes sp. CCFEE 6388]
MSSKQQIQHELALLELEKQELLVKRKELELKQRLAEIEREEQAKTATIDLTEDQNQDIVKHETEEDVETDVSIVEQGDEHETPVFKAETDITPLTLPAREEHSRAVNRSVIDSRDMSDWEPKSDASSNARKGPSNAAGTNSKINLDLRSQHPVDTPSCPADSRQSDTQDLPPTTTPRANSLKRPLSSSGDHTADRLDDLQALSPEQLASVEAPGSIAAEPRKKARVLEERIWRTGNKPVTLERRRLLAAYYRRLLVLHLDTLPVDGTRDWFATSRAVHEKIRSDPYGVHCLINDLVVSKTTFWRKWNKSDKFDETMERFTANWGVWWRTCLTLSRLDEQKAMIKRVVGQIIAGTFDHKEFDKRYT